MKSPEDKAIPYTAVVIVCAIVVTVVIGAVTADGGRRRHAWLAAHQRRR